MRIQWQAGIPSSGLDVGTYTDPASNAVTLIYSQDIRQLMKNNHFRRMHEDNSIRRRSGKFYQVAEIPLVTVMEWKTDHKADILKDEDWQKCVELMHASEYRHVRVDNTHFMKRSKRTLFTGAKTNRTSHPLAARTV